MSHSQETLSSPLVEANELIARFDQEMDAVEQMVSSTHEQEFEEFEQAHNKLTQAKELLSVDEATDVKQAMATVIARLRAKQAREMDEKRLQELNEGLEALEDAYDRADLEDRSYETVARNYLARIEDQQPTGESSVDADIAIARNEFISATRQMNNDAKAYFYLHFDFDSSDK